MFIMFMLFSHCAADNAAYTEPALTPAVTMQPAKASAALERDTKGAEQTANYEELFPYLVLAMASGI
jgi:hypothetical protein